VEHISLFTMMMNVMNAVIAKKVLIFCYSIAVVFSLFQLRELGRDPTIQSLPSDDMKVPGDPVDHPARAVQKVRVHSSCY
jgi:hypothetical protein